MIKANIIVASILLFVSCQIRQGQHQIQKLSLEHCDELNIVYFSKDTFVFKTFDTATINNFAGLITYEKENVTDTCETTEQLIFKTKGQQQFIAQVSTKNIKNVIGCNNITYFFESKKYRHRLTYRTGMGIDEIYWHKVDPRGNPWPGADSTKFHYENIKNDH